MWHPYGFYSWSAALLDLMHHTETLLCRVCSKVGFEESEHKNHLLHTAQHYLIRGKFASDYDEADLIIAIITVFLMAKFMEEFPPMVCHPSGRDIEIDPVFLSHRDQLELCYFDWPVKNQTEYSSFFTYARQGTFQGEDLVSRFNFIDGMTGLFRQLNGTEHFLRNSWGAEDTEVDSILNFSNSLRNCCFCWENPPSQKDWREFFCHLEVDDNFSKEIDEMFGELPAQDEHSIFDKSFNPFGDRPVRKTIAGERQAEGEARALLLKDVDKTFRSTSLREAISTRVGDRAWGRIRLKLSAEFEHISKAGRPRKFQRYNPDAN